MRKRRAATNFISWLYKRSPVFGFVFRNKWFDIGSFETYREADIFISQFT